jgi:hypothetical protein
MLVVVASHYDEAARSLVDRWANQEARLLTCEDLSIVGWQHSVSGKGGETPSLPDSAAVVDGQVVAVEEISGVLTRLPCVFEQELLHIVPDDRAYIASEMNAFLISWLSELEMSCTEPSNT